MPKKSRTYRVVMEPVEDGHWLATVSSVQGCLTQGRTVKEATRRIREALALFVDDADDAELKVELKPPAKAKAEIAKAQKAVLKRHGPAFRKLAKR